MWTTHNKDYAGHTHTRQHHWQHCTALLKGFHSPQDQPAAHRASPSTMCAPWQLSAPLCHWGAASTSRAVHDTLPDPASGHPHCCFQTQVFRCPLTRWRTSCMKKAARAEDGVQQPVRNLVANPKQMQTLLISLTKLQQDSTELICHAWVMHNRL